MDKKNSPLEVSGVGTVEVVSVDVLHGDRVEGSHFNKGVKGLNKKHTTPPYIHPSFSAHWLGWTGLGVAYALCL